MIEHDDEKLKLLLEMIALGNVADPTLRPFLPRITEAFDLKDDAKWKKYCTMIDPRHAAEYVTFTKEDLLYADGRELKKYAPEEITEDLIDIAMDAKAPLTMSMLLNTSKLKKKITNNLILKRFKVINVEKSSKEGKTVYNMASGINEWIDHWDPNGPKLKDLLPDATVHDWIKMISYDRSVQLFSPFTSNEYNLKSKYGYGVTGNTLRHDCFLQPSEKLLALGLPDEYFTVLNSLHYFLLTETEEATKAWKEQKTNKRYNYDVEWEIEHRGMTWKDTPTPLHADKETSDYLMGLLRLEGKLQEFFVKGSCKWKVDSVLTWLISKADVLITPR